jgi:integrase
VTIFDRVPIRDGLDRSQTFVYETGAAAAGEGSEPLVFDRWRPSRLPDRSVSGCRDRLVLLTLAMTGLRRSELIALNWGDVALDDPRPSLLVRRGKGGKPRRQPLPSQLAAALERRRSQHCASVSDPVFCGLGGARLQPTILAAIIRRATAGAGISKHVTAHTLRHTAATWLRQATGDVRLVAEYLGHSDLSTVSRYAHVASEELHDAAQTLADGPDQLPPPPPPGEAPTKDAERRSQVHPEQLAAWE